MNTPDSHPSRHCSGTGGAVVLLAAWIAAGAAFLHADISVPNAGFEAPVIANAYEANPADASWTFVGQAGLAKATGLGAPASAINHPAAPTELVIADAGRSDFQIVVPTAAIPAERHAAEELQRYLHRITGVELPIVDSSAPPRRQEIVLGDCGRPETADIAREIDALGSEGFRIRTRGERLCVLGGRPRGTLYGVYTLLEDYLGVRWFTPEVEVCPARPRVALPALDRTVVPVFEYRDVFFTEAMRDADFCARHRLNGQHNGLEARHGGPAVVFFPFVHSMDALIPPELFASHPEYFPLIDGKRKSGAVQRCLSHPDVSKLAIAKVREWLRDHPEATIISVSQNDNEAFCRCADCAAFDAAEGSHAATMLRLVNAVAAAIAPDFPHVKIETLAYQYTRRPPATLRPRSNVIIRLCSIECCFLHPLAACPSKENRRFLDDVAAWRTVAPRIYVWDYAVNFGHLQQPYPNLESLGPNVRFFAGNGVRGVFEQGRHSTGATVELGALRAYLLAKLLWDPHTDVARHRREFLQACYGRAWQAVDACIEQTHRRLDGLDVHAGIYGSSDAAYLDDRVLDAAETLLAEALTLAENDAVRQRIEVARLPFRYVRLVTGRVTGEARRAMLADFVAVARRAGISHVRWVVTLDEWAERMAAETGAPSSGSPAPAGQE